MLSKRETDYQLVPPVKSEFCRRCKFYQAATSTCAIVEGSIAPGAWCSRFKKGNPTQPGIFEPEEGDHRTLSEIHEGTIQPMEVIQDLVELLSRLVSKPENEDEDIAKTPANPIDYHGEGQGQQPHNSLFASLKKMSED